MLYLYELLDTQAKEVDGTVQSELGWRNAPTQAIMRRGIHLPVREQFQEDGMVRGQDYDRE